MSNYDSLTKYEYSPHPLRVQLRRTKGWRKPEGAVVVARPSKWGNPFVSVVDQPGLVEATLTPHMSRGRLSDPGAAAALYSWWLRYTPEGRNLAAAIDELRGKQLCCWCPLDKPCHADVLAELANS